MALLGNGLSGAINLSKQDPRRQGCKRPPRPLLPVLLLAGACENGHNKKCDT